MADLDYNVNIKFTEEETFGGDTGSRAGDRDDASEGGRGVRGRDRETNDRKRMFQQMEWVFRAFRGVPGIGIIGAIGKDVAVNAKFSQQALGLHKGIGASTIALLAGISLTMFAVLKQSQISTKFSAAFFQVIGAMIDMLLVPFIPVLGKVLEVLLKGFEWTSKHGQTIADLLTGAFNVIIGLLKMVASPFIGLVPGAQKKASELAQEGWSQFTAGIKLFGDAIKAFDDIAKRGELQEQIIDALKQAYKEGKITQQFDVGSISASLSKMPSDILQALSGYTNLPNDLVKMIDNLKNVFSRGMTPTEMVRAQDEARKSVVAGITPSAGDIVYATAKIAENTQGAAADAKAIREFVGASRGEAQKILQDFIDSAKAAIATKESADSVAVAISTGASASKIISDNIDISKASSVDIMMNMAGAKGNTFMIQGSMEIAATAAAETATSLSNAAATWRSMQAAAQVVPAEEISPYDYGGYLYPWGSDFHTGGLVRKSGKYNLLQGETVLPGGMSQKTININAPINIIVGNQPLMPGILGKSLQASLMEGLENQLIRSLT